MDVYRNSCMRSKAHNSLAGGVARAHNPFATQTPLQVVNLTNGGLLMRLLRLAQLALTAFAATSAHASAPDPATLNKIAALSVPFVPNAGQWDPRAAFAAKTFAGTLFVTTEGQLVYSLPGKSAATSVHGNEGLTPSPAARERAGVRAVEKQSSLDQRRTPGWTLTETLVDASGKPRNMASSTLKSPAGYRPMQASVSYFIGSDETKHAKSLNTYERVNLGDMYPGINLQLRATGDNIEKIFTVAPSYDPKQISIALKGAEKLEIGKLGELIAHTGNGPVSFTAPIAYQENDKGERVSVDVAYALVNVGADLAALPGAPPSDAKSSPTATALYTFTLGAFDPTRPLVIDPLLRSTYLGAAGVDGANALAIHPASGEVYVAGYTNSTTTTFPGVSGGAQGTYGGGSIDAFVSRFSADLGTLLRSSYLGAAGSDVALALAIHPASGEVYVAGYTNSTTTTFPGVSGGAQGTFGGGTDAFVSRFSADLGTLLRSSYLGAAGSDVANALAIHPASGEVYVAGYTNSTTTTFPGVSGGAQGTYGGVQDAFVSRFSADLGTLLRSTYLGGAGSDQANALVIHPASGEVYVAGYTDAATTTFPGVSGGAQGSSGGGQDAFVSRFSADLGTLLRSSYLGAAGDDVAYTLAIHPGSGEVYVAGYTLSVTTTFPGLSGGAQGASGGGTDAFVSRFSADLGTLLRSTYLGAAGTDAAYALAIHPASGEVFVAGFTTAATTTFPGVSGGAQGSSGGGTDAFVSRFSADLGTLLRSTYLGAAGNDQPRALAIHPTSGEVVVAGYTDAATTTFPGVSGGAQGSSGGGTDAFVSRFSADLTLNDTTPNAYAFATQTNVPLASTRTSNPALITGIVGAANIYVDGAWGSQYCISSGNNCGCNVSTQFVNTPGTITPDNYVCVRHVSAPIANEVVRSKLHVGGAVASFISTTGTTFTSCNLDIDGSGGAPDAVSDGLMLVRAMLGFTGTAVTNGAIFGSPPRNTWALIRDYLNQNCGTNFAP